jgi:four helix bundle protein
MDDFDIPIFKKTYDLYKVFYSYRTIISKQDRYSIWQQSEEALLNILKNILSASQMYKSEKVPALEKASVDLNLLRVFLRLMKEIKTLDNKKYVNLESSVDEIGRMLGGWIRSSKER